MRAGGIAALCVAVALLPEPSLAQGAPDSLAVARSYLHALYYNLPDSIWAHMTEEDRKNYGSVRGISDLIINLAIEAGYETELVEEKFIRRNGKTQYWRYAKFSGVSDLFLVRIALEPGLTFYAAGWGRATDAPAVDPPPKPPNE